MIIPELCSVMVMNKFYFPYILIITYYSGFHAEPLRGGAGALVEGALQFHKQCGKLIKISSNGRTGRRQK